jgi:hypothetical protein
MFLLEDNTEDLRDYSSGIKIYNFFAKYELGGKRIVTFDPVSGFYLMTAREEDISKFRAYIGGNIKIIDMFGVGITFGNLNSFSTSVDLFDRVSLVLGVYGAQHDLFNFDRSPIDYKLGFDGPEFIAQIRINL